MKVPYVLYSGCLLMSLFSASVMANNEKLPGYTTGASVVDIAVSRAQVDAISNVVYSQIKQTRAVRALHMSMLIPRTADKKPAILYFPGGGFTSADYEKYIEMRMALAEAGFVVAAVEYRVVPAQFPAPVEDAKAAVRYLRQHADDYGIDPSRIGVLGDSAGGWLAQMAATTNGEKAFDKGDFLNQSSDVQAAVTLYGLSNLLTIGKGFPDAIQKVHQSPASTEALLVNGAAFRDFAGASIDADREKALYASPVGHLKGKKPSFLIMHGSADTLVSPEQSVELYQGLRNEGNQAEYVLLKGAAHGDIHWFQKPVIDKVVGWFKATLGKPASAETKAHRTANDNL